MGGASSGIEPMAAAGVSRPIPDASCGAPDPWSAPYSPAFGRPRHHSGRVPRAAAARSRHRGGARPESTARQGLPAGTGRPRRARRLAGLAAAAVGAAGTLTLLLVIALPVPFGYRTLVVMSGSMEPAIPTGSVVVVKRIAAAELAAGDVVSFRPPDAPGRILTHRVQEVRAEGASIAVETRGDANTGVESWAIDPQGKVGRMVLHLPHLGYLLAPLQSLASRLALVVAPAVLLAALLIVDIWRPRPGRGTRSAPATAAATGSAGG